MQSRRLSRWSCRRIPQPGGSGTTSAEDNIPTAQVEKHGVRYRPKCMRGIRTHREYVDRGDHECEIRKVRDSEYGDETQRRLPQRPAISEGPFLVEHETN